MFNNRFTLGLVICLVCHFFACLIVPVSQESVYVFFGDRPTPRVQSPIPEAGSLVVLIQFFHVRLNSLFFGQVVLRQIVDDAVRGSSKFCPCRDSYLGSNSSTEETHDDVSRPSIQLPSDSVGVFDVFTFQTESFTYDRPDLFDAVFVFCFGNANKAYIEAARISVDGVDLFLQFSDFTS